MQKIFFSLKILKYQASFKRNTQLSDSFFSCLHVHPLPLFLLLPSLIGNKEIPFEAILKSLHTLWFYDAFNENLFFYIQISVPGPHQAYHKKLWNHKNKNLVKSFIKIITKKWYIQYTSNCWQITDVFLWKKNK